MNHDYEHCIDFKDDCPESCHRAQLVRDLEQNYPPSRDVSWMNFGDFPDCQRNRLANSSPKAAKNIDDQISRSAIVSALKERAETLKGTCGDLGGACSGAAKLAESMPPVQPEITHEQAVDYLQSTGWLQEHDRQMMLDGARKLTSLPEIIYCKDCTKHNKGFGNYEVHPDGSSTWIWKDSACPLVSWRGKAQGHEFDYQFCAYAERREVRNERKAEQSQ